MHNNMYVVCIMHTLVADILLLASLCAYYVGVVWWNKKYYLRVISLDLQMAAGGAGSIQFGRLFWRKGQAKVGEDIMYVVYN